MTEQSHTAYGAEQAEFYRGQNGHFCIEQYDARENQTIQVVLLQQQANELLQWLQKELNTNN